MYLETLNGIFSFQHRGNQSGQSQGVRSFNSQRTYQNNNAGPAGTNRQNNSSSRNNYSAVSPNQQVPYIPGPYYGAQPAQNGPYNNRGNNGYNQRNNGMGHRVKQPQNVRPNVGYAGFNNNHRPGAAGPPAGYGMPTEFNPFGESLVTPFRVILDLCSPSSTSYFPRPSSWRKRSWSWPPTTSRRTIVRWTSVYHVQSSSATAQIFQQPAIPRSTGTSNAVNVSK